MITVKETTYKNYGKCLSISNGAMELYVTIDLGPRIIKCNLAGRENLMFEDIERQKTQDVSSVFGEGKTWNIYGGHRMWLSPEKFPETYYPDCDKVVYSVNPSGATFEAPVQDVTGLQFSLTVAMDENEPKVKLTHTVKNTKKTAVEGALWCLSVMDKNGVAVLPLPTEDTGLLPSRSLAIWPYTDMSDPHFFWGEHDIAFRQDPAVERPTKIGLNDTVGKAAYLGHGQALVKSFVTEHGTATYPDFGCSAEMYSCNLFMELESLSPIRKIGKNETITHEEEWTLVPDVELGEFTNETVEKLASVLF